MSVVSDDVVDEETTVGIGRLYYSVCQGRRKATVVLGHGAGGGIAARDLVALSASLPLHGYDVVRVEQPWRLAGRKIAPRPEVLDRAWLELLMSKDFVCRRADRLIVGGRSAGARVAARTSIALDARGVVALAFPLHPPGKPERRRDHELPSALPVLVVQGERDSFGQPDEFPTTQRGLEVVAIPDADHGFSVRKAAPITQGEVSELIGVQVHTWLGSLLKRLDRGVRESDLVRGC